VGPVKATLCERMVCRAIGRLKSAQLPRTAFEETEGVCLENPGLHLTYRDWTNDVNPNTIPVGVLTYAIITVQFALDARRRYMS
jgi:hypothetical protein